MLSLRINRPVPSWILQKLLDLQGVSVMASQSQGIHQLLQAEKRAKDKLEDAKKSKSPFPPACEGFVPEWTRGWPELSTELGGRPTLLQSPVHSLPATSASSLKLPSPRSATITGRGQSSLAQTHSLERPCVKQSDKTY